MNRTGPGALTPPAPASKKHPEGLNRDFARFPAIANIADMPDELWALGDIHADYQRATTLLAANGLIQQNPTLADDIAAADDAPWRWAAGTATLVVTGDLIDKGYSNIAVLELLMRLQEEADQAGGRIIVTLGNHEVAFLAKPDNSKTRGPGGLLIELWGSNLSPKAFASDADPRGRWLRQRPLGARVGNWFFAHAGQTSSRTLAGLNNYLVEGLKRDGWGTPTLDNENSLVRARDFYGDDGKQGPELCRILGVDHIAFGHDPDSLGSVGTILAFGAFGTAKQPRHSLFRIDTGLTRLVDYGQGELLRAKRDDAGWRIEALDHRGRARFLSQDPPLAA